MKTQSKTKDEVMKVVFDNELVDVKQLYKDIEKYAPAELLDELSAIGDTLEQMAWKCGWKTDELYRALEANGHRQNYLAVCYYVAATRLRYNRSPNTVKAWALTARFYTPKIASRYGNDILPFSIFTYAASWGEERVPALRVEKEPFMWQMILNYAINEYYNSGYGKAPTVEQLKAVFENKPVKPNDNIIRHIPGLTPTPDMATEDVSADSGDIFLQAFAQALHVVMNGLPKISQKFPKISRVLSGIAMQLSRIEEALEHGVDIDED